MHEILFRGKRLDNGAWETGSLVIVRMGCHDAQYYIADKMTGYHTHVHPSTIGQYTGLEDKNGKRIFEGDICRNTRTGEIVSVKWHGTMAGYVWNKRRADGFLFDFGELFRACDKYEVIGNIHDNSELLKGGEG